MDCILMDKFKECYEISNKVVSKYNELYSIMCQYFLEDSSIYETYVSDIQGLILEEYKIYKNLTLNDIDIMLAAIEKNKWDEDIVGMRIKSKLESLKRIYTKIKINKYVLKLDIVPNNFNFDIFSSLISFIDIEMMRRVKLKLDKLVADNYNDLSFVNSMYKSFNETMIFQAFNNPLTEVVYFNSNMDIDMIPNIDINNLINFIGEILKLDNDCFFSPNDDFLVGLAKITIDRLSNEEFDNNPKTILNCLTLITRLEVMIDYLNKDCLNVLLDYCNGINNNQFCINQIVSVLKKRMK